MEKKEAIKIVKELVDYMDEYETIETEIKDVQALNFLLNKVESNVPLFKKLRDGLLGQFDELGKEIGVDGNSANVARVRIETADKIIELEKEMTLEKAGKSIDNLCNNLLFDIKADCITAEGLKIFESNYIEPVSVAFSEEYFKEMKEYVFSKITTKDLLDELRKRDSVLILKKDDKEETGAVG